METIVVEKPEKLAKVKLIGTDGNSFALLGLCVRAGRKAKYTNDQIKAFREDATAGDYDHLLSTCSEWFDVQ